MVLLEALPERQPALLSLVYTAGLAVMILWLAAGLLRGMRPRRSALPSGPPAARPAGGRRRRGAPSTTRGLSAVGGFFVLPALTVFAFHVYWAHYAPAE